jgi:hypothetical protein
MPLSEFAKQEILKSVTGNAGAFSNVVYLGLSSSEPFAGDSVNITEPITQEGENKTSYSRVRIGNNGVGAHSALNLFTYHAASADASGNPVPACMKNHTEIYFPESTASWNFTAKYFVLFRTATGTRAEDVIAWGKLNSDVAVNSANLVVMFRPGELTVQLIENVATA